MVTFPCDGCGIPDAIQLYMGDGTIYTDGALSASASCKNNTTGTSIWDGSMTTLGEGCIYRPIPRVFEISGKWILTMDDCKCYRSPNADSTPVLGFCPANWGVWILEIQCNGSDLCHDVPGTRYPIWVGHLASTSSPLGWYSYIYGNDTANPLLEMRETP